MGRLEPAGQLEFRTNRQDRSFSGPPPAGSRPDTPGTRYTVVRLISVQGSLIFPLLFNRRGKSRLVASNLSSIPVVVVSSMIIKKLTPVNVSGPVEGGVPAEGPPGGARRAGEARRRAAVC